MMKKDTPIEIIKRVYGLPLSGGDGTTIENAIIINEEEDWRFVEIERLIISGLVQLMGFENWRLGSSRIIENNESKIDEVMAQIIDNKNKVIKEIVVYYDMSKIKSYW